MGRGAPAGSAPQPAPQRCAAQRHVNHKACTVCATQIVHSAAPQLQARGASNAPHRGAGWQLQQRCFVNTSHTVPSGWCVCIKPASMVCQLGLRGAPRAPGELLAPVGARASLQVLAASCVSAMKKKAQAANSRAVVQSSAGAHLGGCGCPRGCACACGRGCPCSSAAADCNGVAVHLLTFENGVDPASHLPDPDPQAATPQRPSFRACKFTNW